MHNSLTQYVLVGEKNNSTALVFCSVRATFTQLTVTGSCICSNV